jgi:hypothetical protein
MSYNLILEGEESLMEEVNEAKCLCDELKITKNLFFVFLSQTFLLLIWFLLLLIERKTILLFFTLEDESLIAKMFLNKQEAHNIKEKVVQMASRDTQEEV